MNSTFTSEESQILSGYISVSHVCKYSILLSFIFGFGLSLAKDGLSLLPAFLHLLQKFPS
jgi:hypothetical protein